MNSLFFRYSILTIYLYLSYYEAVSQNQADTSKLKFFGKVGHWIAAYEMSGSEFLEDEKLNFKQKAYSFTYIDAVIETDEWLFSRLNQVTLSRTGNKTAPYFHFSILLKPNPDFSQYNLDFSLTSEGTDIDNFTAYENRLKKAFNKRSYGSPAEAMPDLQTEIAIILGLLADDLGNSLQPNILFRIYNTNLTYRDGEQIDIDPQVQQTIELEVIDKSGEVISNDRLEWKNASPVESRAVVDLREYPSQLVSVKYHGKPIRVEVRLKNNVENIRELVRSILIETLATTRQNSLDSIHRLKGDSADIKLAFLQQQKLLESLNVQSSNSTKLQSGGIYALYSEPVKYSKEEAKNFYADPKLKKGAETAGIMLKTNKKKQRHLDIVALVDKLLYQPESLDELLEALLNNSGEVLARLLLGKNREGKSEEARGIIVQYINETIIRSAYEN